MANFYNNLRAARANAASDLENLNMPVTGEDSQQERNITIIPQSSFFDVFRSVFLPSALRQKKQAEPMTKYVDRGSPGLTEEAQIKESERTNQANAGMLYAEGDAQKGFAAERGTFFRDDDLAHYISRSIADNYDWLNALLDDYDAASSWGEKQMVIDNARKNSSNLPEAVVNWLEELDYQTTMGRNYGGTDPKAISDNMRWLNDVAKKAFSPKRI